MTDAARGAPPGLVGESCRPGRGAARAASRGAARPRLPAARRAARRTGVARRARQGRLEPLGSAALRPAGDQHAGRRRGPAGQRDPLGLASRPSSASQRAAVRRPRRRAVGRHDQHPLVGEVRGEEGQQVERRPVGPVHVLDDVDDRPGRRPAGRAGRAPPGTAAAGFTGRRGGASGPAGHARQQAGQLRRAAGAPDAPRPSALLRRAWVSAAYGSGSPATGTQAPANGTDVGCARSSRTRRVLPTPVSPETTTTVGWPPAARASAADSRRGLASRPTSRGGRRRPSRHYAPASTVGASPGLPPTGV